MSGKTLYVKLAFLIVVLGTFAMFLGNDPWGPI